MTQINKRFLHTSKLIIMFLSDQLDQLLQNYSPDDEYFAAKVLKTCFNYYSSKTKEYGQANLEILITQFKLTNTIYKDFCKKANEQDIDIWDEGFFEVFIDSIETENREQIRELLK